MAELQLSESELALYSALVLLQPGKRKLSIIDDDYLTPTFSKEQKLTWTKTSYNTDRPDLRQVSHVRRLNLFISRSLRAELNKTHHRSPFDSTSLNVYDTLISKIPILREISMLHMGALSRFRRLSPQIEFPALHRELFSMDISE